MTSSRALLALALLALAACDDPPGGVVLEAIAFSDIDDWSSDDQASALRAFERSCIKLSALPPERAMGRDGIAGTASHWQTVCKAIGDSPNARAYFETYFQAYVVVADGEHDGLFTGYYEPMLHGSRSPKPGFEVPLRAMPEDLVTASLGRFDSDLKGKRITGHVVDGRLVPYPERSAINDGVIDAISPAFLWVDDEIDKFFLQIQGSGQVRLSDGSVVRVGYAGQNGQPYRAIGRDLIEMGALTREEVSLQTIRAWLAANPDKAAEIMHKNRSYIFFHELTELAGASGPLGSQNVPLEPERSLAVDRSFWPMGLPVWLETTAPMPQGDVPWRHLLIAQDTGGAIRGPIRGDVFWGAGDKAEHVAGHMKSEGRMIILLPKAAVPAS